MTPPAAGMTATAAAPGAASGASAPAFYNAAADLLERNLPARASKTAFVDELGMYTYGELAERVARAGAALRALGLDVENRVVLGLLDTIDFPVAFLGAIQAGIVPIPVNTLFPALDYAYILDDSRAKAAVVSVELLPQFEDAARQANWGGTIVVSDPRGTYAGAWPRLQALLDAAAPLRETARTRPDDVCFWLYSSGSTGKPKGTVHVHTSLIRTAELFAQAVLGFAESDVVFSAAKLFFAYGLGNALTFPLAVGATSVLYSGRATPDAVLDVLRRER
ncbi:MAG: benzoate-CoA ligase, partial [Candidatus Eremiobacteraeota bacterium]|nr:benzoate-CoA ligase [Candidatus Eremiobacteraeota bacterium]